MAADVVMPRLSDSMEEGTILAWLKRVGEQVARGDALVEIETDKANMAYESDVAGTLIEVLAAEGQSRSVGAVIARIGEAGEQPAGDPVASDVPAAAEERAAARTPATPDGRARVNASPIARRIARERGLDLAAVTGSGPGGRIVRADVEGAAAATASPRSSPAVAPPDGADAGAKGTVRTVELTRLQQAVARRMSESRATAPHFSVHVDVDMSAAVEARARLKALAAAGEAIPSFNDMVVKACALALREMPRANGSYRDGRFELYSRVNVGVAVAADDALVVPTIRDADRKGLRQIAEESRSLAARVRDGSITPPELSGATFSVSNLGMLGVASFEAVIDTPQAAILAVGEIAERPVVRDGAVVPAHVMSMTLSCDHRILYGADGARFLARVRALLEEPLGLAL